MRRLGQAPPRCRQCDRLIAGKRLAECLYHDKRGRPVWLCGLAMCAVAYERGDAPGSLAAATARRPTARTR